MIQELKLANRRRFFNVSLVFIHTKTRSKVTQATQGLNVKMKLKQTLDSSKHLAQHIIWISDNSNLKDTLTFKKNLLKAHFQ